MLSQTLTKTYQWLPSVPSHTTIMTTVLGSGLEVEELSLGSDQAAWPQIPHILAG